MDFTLIGHVHVRKFSKYDVSNLLQCIGHSSNNSVHETQYDNPRRSVNTSTTWFPIILSKINLGFYLIKLSELIKN